MVKIIINKIYYSSQDQDVTWLSKLMSNILVITLAISNLVTETPTVFLTDFVLLNPNLVSVYLSDVIKPQKMITKSPKMTF